MLLTSVEPFIGSTFTAVWLTRFGSRDYRYLKMTPPTACPTLKTIHSEGFQDDPISRRVFWGRGCLRRPCTAPACVPTRRDASRTSSMCCAFLGIFTCQTQTAEPCSSLNECEVSGTAQLWQSVASVVCMQQTLLCALLQVRYN